MPRRQILGSQILLLNRFITLPLSSKTQRMVPRPVAPVVPGNLLETQILGSQPRPT